MLNNFFWFTGNKKGNAANQGEQSQQQPSNMNANANVRRARNRRANGNNELNAVLNNNMMRNNGNSGSNANNNAKVVKRVHFNENELNQMNKIEELSRELKKLERAPVTRKTTPRMRRVSKRRNTPHPFEQRSSTRTRPGNRRKVRVVAPRTARAPRAARMPRAPRMQINAENREILRMGRILNNFETKYKKIKQLEKNVELCKKEKEQMLQYQKQIRHYKERIVQLESIIRRLGKIIR